MALTTKLPNSAAEFAALPQSDWIDVRDSVTTAETFAVPDGAQFVLFSATGTFYAKFGTATSAPTAVVPSGDVADGTASLCNPTFRRILPGQTLISVAAPSSVDITAEYFAGVSP
jgi:hypothetical protein